jgi:hypothetical protein
MALHGYLRSLPSFRRDPSGQDNNDAPCCRCFRWKAEQPGTNAFVVCCNNQPTVCKGNNYDNLPYPGWKTCVMVHEGVHVNDCDCGSTNGQPGSCQFPNGGVDCSECAGTAAEVNCLFDQQDTDCGSNDTCRLEYACRIYEKCMDENMYCASAGVPPEHECGTKPSYCE